MAKTNEPYSGNFKPGEAAQSIVGLSQVLLAPLDSIFKAQIHAARSFLNLVLQMGFPHVGVDSQGDPINEDQVNQPKPELYYQEFEINTLDSDRKPVKAKIKIPALALVPLNPLSIEEASFDLDFKITHVEKHQQIQSSESEALKKEDISSKKKYDESKRALKCAGILFRSNSPPL